ncbi:polysaccharide biosynthesis/export family protein [Phaeovulum sp.]|uniref:polysaccharide biosynthesis/export family protein n=1 Tax=Phaeovulum sp. TaxID=2934796 RepID=UPI0039E4AB61
MSYLRIFPLCTPLLFLSACAGGFVSFPVEEQAQKSLAENVTIIRLDATNIASFSSPAAGHAVSSLPAGRGWDYRVGTGDTLSVIVFDHPELTLPAGEKRSAAESGFRVQADGTFFYPFIGQVAARGLPPETIRADLTTRLADYIPNPQIEVRVAEFNSQSVVVAGEVATPNRQNLTTVPLTLIEAINAAGGLRESADTRRVTVQRAGRPHNVDLEGFLVGQVPHNNPTLRNGDVVNVPRRTAQEAYLLGQIDKPDVIDLSLEPISLTQAITRSGGLDEKRADTRGIFVFRLLEGRITVFQLETGSPTGLLIGTRFALEPRDVVYVVRSPLARWNDVISGLLPTINALVVGDSVKD